MLVKGYSIREASEELGISTRSVRRMIQRGQISAQLVNGKHGETYQITALPPQIAKKKGVKRTLPPYTLDNKVDHTLVKGLLEDNKALQAEVKQLAYQLGTLEATNKALEDRVKLLTEGRVKAKKKRPWREVFFGRH